MASLRPPPVCRSGVVALGGSRRAHARRAERRCLDGQFLGGWWGKRHVGSRLSLYAIAHASRHRYQAVAQRSRNEVRLQPRNTRAHQLEHFHLEVTPDAELSSSVDYFGNAVWLVSVEAPHLELVITAHSEVR